MLKMFLHFDEVWNQVCLNSSPRDGVGPQCGLYMRVVYDIKNFFFINLKSETTKRRKYLKIFLKKPIPLSYKFCYRFMKQQTFLK